ncbi:YdeI/OmpD-associated family protein [Algoriphagus litoralis]|uniref:YdeI/OmpD-associated family protein n=1 Tax=Algoriphagus litoralis TaxID=2202829 RepID=UPI000DB9F51E|nr:YdeI/OmpD-associated family protein [Algoriphagus litoralis]
MELIIEGEFFLERFPGKGGWTFIKIPSTLLPSGKAFGMLKVGGTIDDFTFEGKHLMPMGDGHLFMPIAKPIRQAIGKEEGDRVHFTLYRDEIPTSIPAELIDCLEDDPGKLVLFQKLSDAEQKQWIEYIYSANSEETKANRIVKLLSDLGQKA